MAASSLDFNDTEIAFRSRSTPELRKALLLFRSLGNTALATAGPKLVNLALTLRLPVTPIIRWTVFEQFCGGVTLEDCEARVRELARFGIRSIPDYSVEGLGREEDFDETAAEVRRVIDRAKADKDLSFAVFKVTGIARFDLLAKVSAKGKLSADERREFERVTARFDALCDAAAAAGVRILVDAEESWIQDAIDELTIQAMRRLNRERAIVFETVQMYRHDRYAFLGRLLEAGRSDHFHVGVKIVRGAYMEKERARAAELGYPSPIQPDKAATDRDFDRAVILCLDHIDTASLFAGSHNEQSTQQLAEKVVARGLKRNDPRVEFSQLLGMSDHLSYNLAHHGFNVCKYLPYGPVKAVMPYLIRRAAENTSIQGQAGRELQLIERELKRRSAH